MTVMKTKTAAKSVAVAEKTSPVEKNAKTQKQQQNQAKSKPTGDGQQQQQEKQPSPQKQQKLQKQQPKGPAKNKIKRGHGCVFIKHLPKGFHEDELRQFFEQFGNVIRVCVARSRKTQQSKGYGYVQFQFYEVAEIAANAVNNYMLFNRVLKTSLLPKRMTNIPLNFGKAYTSKGEMKEAYQRWLKKKVRRTNSHLGGQRESERCTKQISRLMRAEKELAAAGIKLPELANTLSKLKEKATDLGKVQQDELSKMKTPKAKKKKQQSGPPQPDDTNTGKQADTEEEDEDSEFTLLQPSDWKDVKMDVTKSNTVENKNKATKKAQETQKQFELEKGASKLQEKATGKVNKKITPKEKQPKKETLPLSKKKAETSKGVSPVGKKAKQQVAVKEVKAAKKVKKVK